MNLSGHDIGVCSWSLQPKDTADLIEKMRELGLSHLQLAIAPLIGLDLLARQTQINQLREAGITITAGMLRFAGEDFSTIARIRQTGGFMPDDLWAERRETAALAAGICRDYGIKLLSMHAGFIPPSSGEKYSTMAERIAEVASALEQDGVSMLIETGQESASELLQFLNDLKSRFVGVNFDPANIILYGAGDPVEAVHTLGRHINHVHMKDAKESDQPGTIWGADVPLGTGEVPIAEFLLALKEVGYRGALVIEREAGQSRLTDIQEAIETLRTQMAMI